MLKADHLQKIIVNKKSTISILTDCSLELSQGTTCSIMGASGSGKSTLMHLLAGFDTPTTGTVFLDGVALRDLSVQERAKKIAFVPQRPFFIKELSVLENIVLAGSLVGLDQRITEKRTEELLEDLGLSAYKKSFIGELSGGQQQRVALARALVVEPHYLLADEPTGSLDQESGEQLLDLLVSCVKKYQMGLIITTHNQAVATTMELVFLLKHGILEPVIKTV